MFKRFFTNLFEDLIRNIGGGVGRKLRYIYYRNIFAKCGENVVIDIGVKFGNPKNIFLGNNVWIDDYVILMAGKVLCENVTFKENENYHGNEGEIHINDYVHIAPFSILQGHGGISISEKSGIAAGSKLYSMSNHYSFENSTNKEKRFYPSPLMDKNSQSIIIGPISIGVGCAIGLNSVILPGTNIPNGMWLGVNSYLSSGVFIEDAIYASRPAQRIPTT
jgi:acetyltransferase-like isoleucine patch superfamily enzyme